MARFLKLSPFPVHGSGILLDYMMTFKALKRTAGWLPGKRKWSGVD